MATPVSPALPNYNPEKALDDGPMDDSKRGCTDIIFCLLFIASWVALVVVASFGLANGNPMILTYPIDSSNNSCGYTRTYESYPYLFYPIPFPGYFNLSVCIAQCPVGNETILECQPNLNITSCRVTGTNQVLAQYVSAYASLGYLNNATLKNNFFTYNTTGFANRFCIPTGQYFQNLSGLSQGLLSAGGDRVTQWATDLYICWTIILASAAIAIVFGFVWMVLMKYCSGVITWVSIALFIALFAVLGGVFYKRAVNEYDTYVSLGQTPVSGTTQYDDIQALKIWAYICWALTGLFVIITCCIFKSIRIAIAVIKSAADYVKDTPQALLVPVVMIFFLTGYYVFWIIVALYLYSYGTPYSSGDSPLASIEWNSQTKKMLIFWLFELLWNNAFLIAMANFILASSVCMWYFAQNTGQGPRMTVSKSVYRAWRYHLGSLAFGSLILAIVQFIKLWLRYVEWQMKKLQTKNTKFILYIVKCMQCCVGCAERFVNFLNKNAYIQIALTGDNFCTAARHAFSLITSNPVRFGLVSMLGEIFIFVGKAFITILAALIGYVIITQSTQYSTKIYSPIFPTIAFVIVGYAISELFMSVYGMAANTILHCFCLDEKLQEAERAPPRHCPDQLKAFIDEHRQPNAKH
jgi:hypothetical protein